MKKLNNLLIRSIAGIIFSAVIVTLAWLSPWTLGVLFFVFAMAGLYEFYLITGSRGEKPRLVSGMVLGGIVYVLQMLNATEVTGSDSYLLLAILLPLIFCLELIRPSADIAVSLSKTIAGVVYVVLPFALLNHLASATGTFEYGLPIGFFLLLWGNDSGAYLLGKYFGKHKLYVKVSPNKTWEGLAAGVALCIFGGWVMSVFFPVLPLSEWLCVAVLVAVFGNLGDLFESQIKRAYNIKDSGNLIPGHGGVLDRFDGLFFALPVVFAYIYYIYH
ncbi:MAG: phosphatidate cytidylyltransferase [Crocinitomicaceae bacterium]|nr:phosphatidate cytidylyltransferase [Crocinitomicaceae bacterium]